MREGHFGVVGRVCVETLRQERAWLICGTSKVHCGQSRILEGEMLPRVVGGSKDVPDI